VPRPSSRSIARDDVRTTSTRVDSERARSTAQINIVAARLLVPAWLLVIAGLQIADGTTAALPLWLTGMAIRSGVSPELLLRLLLGSEFLLAGLMLLLGRWSRGVAFIALLGVTFSAIASIAAAPTVRSIILVNGALLVVSGLLFAAIRRSAADTRADTLSPQWRALGALAVLVIAATVASRVEIRPAADQRRLVGPTAKLVAAELDFASYIGKPFAETPIREHLPELTALTLEGRSYVVFYNPRCGSCHTLFETHFAGAVEGKVIAVKVPPERNAVLLPTDQPETVNCPECHFLELPAGPVWLMTPPVLVVVDDGVITCVDERGGDACMVPPPPAATGS